MLLPRGTKKENESRITCQQALKWFTALPVGFQEGGKVEYPVKNSWGKATTNNKLNPHLTPGHSGGKGAFSPLLQPCSSINNIAYKRDCYGGALINDARLQL